MQDPNEISGLDALADAVAARLSSRLSNGNLGGQEPRPYPNLEPFPEITFGSTLGIAGVEYTQSIQYNGLVSPTYGPDNGVPLVAYKTMVVRVYPFVKRGALGGDSLTGQRVTGQLTLSIGDRVIFQSGPTRVDGVRVGATSNIDRGLWDREFFLPGSIGSGPSLSLQPSIFINSTLNFIVPAYYCRLGRIYATVKLWPVADGSMSAKSAHTTQYLQFIDVQAPKICLERVNWTDSARMVTKPSDADMLATLELATRMLPFPYFESTIIGLEETSSAAFATPATGGGCNTAWTDLDRKLRFTLFFTSLFQIGDILFAMVPQAAIPATATSINSGCGIGTGGVFVGFNSTFAHELGHVYQRPHVAVAGDTSSDPNYPNYGGSRKSIGEIGIDTGTTPPTLFDPSNSIDIMSYVTSGENQWISPYTYQKILDARGLHQSAPIDPRRLRPLLIMDFRVHRYVQGLSRVEIRKVARIEAPGRLPPPPLGARSPISIDLLDSEGRILATHHCTWAPAHGGGDCGCGCGGPDVPLEREPWLDFQEAIEWPSEQVASISFHKGEDAFHTIAVGEAPDVSIEGPEWREQNIVIRVNASHPRETVSIIVLFSSDDGMTWQPVAFDPPNGEVTIAIDNLQGGEKCVFRAIGTAELQSTTKYTEPFSLARTPRRLYLKLPSGDCTMASGHIALSVMVDTRGLGAIAPQDIRWTSSLDGDLGFGYTLTPYLSEGRHEITLTAPDGLGGTLVERGIIVIGGRSR